MKNIMILATMVLVATGCVKKQEAPGRVNINDTTMGKVIADTIIYNVSIINHNPDDIFGQQSLKGLKREELLSEIFNMVYSSRAAAFDHTTGEKMTVAQVQKMEETGGISRDNIDMIQFREIWYMNPSGATLTKKVISMVLGSQVFDSYGNFIANKAVLRVELNK